MQPSGPIRLAPTIVSKAHSLRHRQTIPGLFYRIAHSKVVERWSVVDVLTFFKELDVIEYTEKGKELFLAS